MIVACTGKYGQLGHGDRENKYSPVPVLTLEGKQITQVQCGRRHTMALTSTTSERAFNKVKMSICENFSSNGGALPPTDK